MRRRRVASAHPVARRSAPANHSSFCVAYVASGLAYYSLTLITPNAAAKRDIVRKLVVVIAGDGALIEFVGVRSINDVLFV